MPRRTFVIRAGAALAHMQVAMQAARHRRWEAPIQAPGFTAERA